MTDWITQVVTGLGYAGLGTALWSGALAYAGMVLGEQYEQVDRVMQWATYAVVGLILLGIARRVIKKKRAE